MQMKPSKGEIKTQKAATSKKVARSGKSCLQVKKKLPKKMKSCPKDGKQLVPRPNNAFHLLSFRLLMNNLKLLCVLIAMAIDVMSYSYFQLLDLNI